MREHVSIIPEDKAIIVDGEGMIFDFYSGPYHAIQWHNGSGHIERTDGSFNQMLTTEHDYNSVVYPFVAAWEVEKAKREQALQLTPDQIIEQTIAQYEQKIEDRLNSFAKTAAYNSMLSCCTYATSVIPMYAAEGQYCVNLRDMTWIKAYELINEMLPIAQAGGHIPSWEEIESQLPVPAWPEGSRNNPATEE